MIKRIIDIVLSFTGLILLSPVFLFVVLLILFTMGRPIFFQQERAGLHGKPFRLYKFRTMTNDVTKSDRERITKVGRILRKYSIDEIPQLFNVLKGDMSLVGPRPLLMEYLPLYNQEQRKRHEVKPGITGWAQVNGRNAITWEEKFSLDVWYVENRSCLLDFKIFLLTIRKVIRQEGINQDEHTTMEKFTGT